MEGAGFGGNIRVIISFPSFIAPCAEFRRCVAFHNTAPRLSEKGLSASWKSLTVRPRLAVNSWWRGRVKKR